MNSLNFNLENILNILALFAALLFVVQIIFLKKRSFTNSVFAGYLGSLGVVIVFFLFLDLEKTLVAYAILPFLMFSVLSIGPILWIYLNLVIGESFKSLRKHLIIPFVFGGITLLIYVLDNFILDDDNSKIVVELLQYIVLSGLSVVFLIQNGYYIFKTFKLYKLHSNRIAGVYSYTEKINLKWFRYLVFGYIGFILSLITVHIVDDSWSYILFYLTLLGYVVFSGYNALHQEPIFTEDILNEIKGFENPTLLDVDRDVFKGIEKRLLTIMDVEQLYLNDSLTIQDVASKINTNSKYLSFLINNTFHKNFVSFVNEYRIQEAKKLLLNPEKHNFTIEYIGYNSGFKSKSAFNSAFKKITGETPSAFKKKNIV